MSLYKWNFFCGHSFMVYENSQVVEFHSIFFIQIWTVAFRTFQKQPNNKRVLPKHIRLEHSYDTFIILKPCQLWHVIEHPAANQLTDCVLTSNKVFHLIFLKKRCCCENTILLTRYAHFYRCVLVFLKENFCYRREFPLKNSENCGQ